MYKDLQARSTKPEGPPDKVAVRQFETNESKRDIKLNAVHAAAETKVLEPVAQDQQSSPEALNEEVVEVDRDNMLDANHEPPEQPNDVKEKVEDNV